MGILLGRKQSTMGLFIGRTNVNPISTSYDPDDERFLFSSEWGRTASIYRTGTCAPDQHVSFPTMGYRPLIRFEQIAGTVIDQYPYFQATVAVSQDSNEHRDWTQFILTYTAVNAFIINKRDTSRDTTDISNILFRYLVFNLSVE